MWFADRSKEGDLYSQYMDMSNISLKTFEKHLAGDWEYVFFNKFFPIQIGRAHV